MPTLVFTASGTWNPPADWPGFATKVECLGPGGTGSARASTTRGGNGGGGGEYAAESGVVYISGSKTYTIGTSGSGTATSFPCDSVTVTAHAAGNATTAAAGLGGTGSANSVHFNGGAGRLTPAATASGGGGGGAAGPSGAGSTAPSNIGGAADNSTVAAPAAGVAGNSGTEWTTAGSGTGGSGFASGTNNGTAGGQAGGGGAGASDGGAASTGGAAGHGVIAVTYISANLVPSEDGVQVIVFPPPQHYVLAPGRLYYRQPAETPPSTVTPSLPVPTQPSGGVASFGPSIGVLMAPSASSGADASFTPQIGAVPSQAVSTTAAEVAFAIQETVALMPTQAAGGQAAFGIRADANATLIAATSAAAEAAFGIATGQSPSLVAVAATAAEVIFGDTVTGPLAAAASAGAAGTITAFPATVVNPAAVAAAGSVAAFAISLTNALSGTTAVANIVGTLVSELIGQFAPAASAGSQAALTPNPGATLGSAAAIGAVAIVSPVTSLLPGEYPIRVVVYPQPRHYINRLYYRQEGTEIQVNRLVNLPAAVALAAVSGFGFPLVPGAAVGAVTPFVAGPTPLLPAVVTAGAGSPLSIFTGAMAGASASGNAAPLGPFFPLVAVAASGAVVAIGPQAIAAAIVSGAVASLSIAEGEPFFAAPAVAAANAFGRVVLLGPINAVGTGAPIGIALNALPNGAAALGQSAAFAGSLTAQFAPASSAGATAALGPSRSDALLPVAISSQAEQFSFANLTSVPMGPATLVGAPGILVPSPLGIPSAVATAGATGAFAPFLPAGLISGVAVGNVRGIVPQATLVVVSALGAERTFGPVDQVPLLPLAIADGQVGPIGTGTVPLRVVVILTAIGQIQVGIFELAPPSPPPIPFYPLGRGRLAGGIRVVRVSRVR